MLEKFKGYLVYIILVLVIGVLFFSISYSSLNGSGDLKLVLNGESVGLEEKLQYIDNKLYVSYADAANVLKKDIFKESALKKIIITANNMVKTYTLNSDISYTNFEENEKSDVYIYRSYEDKEYILLSELCSVYGYVVLEDTKLNVVSVLEENFEEATLKYDRVYGYVTKGIKKDKVALGKSAVVSVVKDDEYYDTNSKYVLCVVEQENKCAVYILKEDLNIQFEAKKEEISENSFKTFVQNEDNLETAKSENTDYIYSTFKLVSSAGDIDEVYEVKALDNNSYAMITNGYKASNFDSNITTYVLQNMVSRQTVITRLAESIKDADVKGVVVNFRDFKVASTEYFTQFVKELSMYLHSLGKEVIVYIPLDAAYIDNASVLLYADYCIFIEYGVKSENSKTSGSDSSPKFIEESIAKLKESGTNLNKVIIEIPMYSLLWTEKEQKVTNVQYMYSATLADYISKNALTPVLDEASGQMYAEQVKGSLTYKMWLEDEYSINKKINIAKDNMLGGVVLYKKGYEPKDIKI